MYRLTIAVAPPTSNARLGAAADHLYRKAEVTRWRRGVAILAKAQLRGQGLAAPIDEDLVVLYVVRIPNGRRDWDASLKDLQDALNGVLWKDDRRIRLGLGGIDRRAATASFDVWAGRPDEAAEIFKAAHDFLTE